MTNANQKDWTEAEYKALRKAWKAGARLEDLPAILPGRTAKAARQKAYALKFERGPMRPVARKGYPWTEEELMRLREVWAQGTGYDQLESLFPGRTKHSVKVQASRLGLVRGAPELDYVSLKPFSEETKFSIGELMVLLDYYAFRGRRLRKIGQLPKLKYERRDAEAAVIYWTTVYTFREFCERTDLAYSTHSPKLWYNTFPAYCSRTQARLTEAEWVQVVSGRKKIKDLFVPESWILSGDPTWTPTGDTSKDADWRPEIEAEEDFDLPAVAEVEAEARAEAENGV